MLIAAIADIPAGLIVALVSLLAATAAAMLALRQLGVREPWNAVAVFHAVRKPSTWHDLAIASGFIAIAVGLAAASSGLNHLAGRMTAAAGRGDIDLMTAWLVCILGLTIAVLARAWFRSILKEATQSKQPAVNLNAVSKFHAVTTSCCELLAMASIGLLPAALLLNWAWNVAASVLAPMWLVLHRFRKEPGQANGQS